MTLEHDQVGGNCNGVLAEQASENFAKDAFPVGAETVEKMQTLVRGVADQKIPDEAAQVPVEVLIAIDHAPQERIQSLHSAAASYLTSVMALMRSSRRWERSSRSAGRVSRLQR